MAAALFVRASMKSFWYFGEHQRQASTLSFGVSSCLQTSGWWRLEISTDITDITSIWHPPVPTYR